MTRAQRLAQLPDWPASMSLETAAAYCELPIAVFKRSCPVAPRLIGGHARYGRAALDRWLDGGIESATASRKADQWLSSDPPHQGH